MNELSKQVITYSAAEQLAKDADFQGASIEPYLKRAERYYGGEDSVFTDAERQTMRIQELHLDDDEVTVLEENPELQAEYAESDVHQLAAASDTRNLDFYLEQGVDYEFDPARMESLRGSLDMNQAVSAQLMRERVVSMPGLNHVRLSVVYHDMMDHLWAISQLQEAGLDTRYSDFMAEVGNPFSGFLFSKQAELLSGIGYNTRRLVTNPGHYGSMAASTEAISAHLGPSAEKDERIANALEKINNSNDLSQAAGFVINGALGSLLLQRSRTGAVKRIVNSSNGREITNTPVSLLDARYLSVIIEGVESLLSKSQSYKQMQLNLNLTVESMLRECLELNHTVGYLALGSARDTSNVPVQVRDALTQNAGVSTSYYV